MGSSAFLPSPRWLVAISQGPHLPREQPSTPRAWPGSVERGPYPAAGHTLPSSAFRGLLMVVGQVP